MKLVSKEEFFSAVMSIDVVINIPSGHQCKTAEYKMRHSGKLVGVSIDTDDYDDNGSVARTYYLSER